MASSRHPPVAASALLLLLLAHIATAAAAAAAAAEPSPVQVNVTGGAVRGYVAINGTARVGVWKGIPFAQPPVGDLRWRPPRPATPWQGVLDTTALRHNCLQNPGPQMMGWTQPLDQLSEDCLYLNVYAPLRSSNSSSAADSNDGGSSDASGTATPPLLPVILWVYGGGFQGGGANETRLNGTWVAMRNQDAVVVTFNYRLNVFGFLAAEALRGRDDTGGNSTGNYGIQDQRLAMQWVHDNIAAFGGDPSRVMLVGQSAGAASVSEHLVRPRSWGLFATAGMESGAFYSQYAQPTVADQRLSYEFFLGELGCARAADPVQCIVEADAGKVLNVTLPPVHTQWMPTIDGADLTNTAVQLAKEGKIAPGVPLLLGSVSEDIALFGTSGCNPSECSATDFLRFARGNVGLNASLAEELQSLYVDEPERPGGNYTSWYWAEKHAGADAWAACPARRLANWSTSSPGRQQSPQDAFLYYWSFVPAGPNGAYPKLAHHACEQPFVFHVLAETPAQTAESGGAFHIAQQERVFSETIVDLWTSFAAARAPAAAGVEWPAYAAARQTLEISQTAFTPTADLRASRCDFWDRMFDAHFLSRRMGLSFH